MELNNINELKDYGFTGFLSIGELQRDGSPIPRIMGVYLVLYEGITMPNFLPVGTGGFFKGKDPNIPMPELKSNWVDDTLVIYIGKAGSISGSATLRSRLSQYFRFGQGANVGHYGGRLIWQIKSSKSLKVCWKPLTDEEPRIVEAGLIQEFIAKYGKRPFANLTG